MVRQENEVPQETFLKNPLQLSGQQRALYEALSKKEEKLASMYLGSLFVLRQSENPDSLALAAHGLRELMEKLPQYFDLPVEVKPPSLKVKVRELTQKWSTIIKKTKCLGNPKWSGPIDSPLQGFLEKAQEFFCWFEVEHSTRKQQTAKVLRGLDPTGQSLPKTIEQLRIEEWDSCHDYFQGVSHHTKISSLADFSVWVEILERFLLDRLLPRTFEDFSAIDQIIQEGERNA